VGRPQNSPPFLSNFGAGCAEVIGHAAELADGLALGVFRRSFAVAVRCHLRLESATLDLLWRWRRRRR
jgi:hypothetical protein